MAVSGAVVGGVLGGLGAALLLLWCCLRRKRDQPFHTLDGHLDEEERRFKDALDKQANIDDLFDFDQDDVEFDERELEQVGDYMDNDDIELGVPRPSPSTHPEAGGEGGEASDDDAPPAGGRKNNAARFPSNTSPPEPKGAKPKLKAKQRTGHAD